MRRPHPCDVYAAPTELETRLGCRCYVHFAPNGAWGSGGGKDKGTERPAANATYISLLTELGGSRGGKDKGTEQPAVDATYISLLTELGGSRGGKDKGTEQSAVNATYISLLAELGGLAAGKTKVPNNRP